MDLRNCPECGKVFVFVSRDLCPDCFRKEEEMFKKIQKYLRRKPQATVAEISEATAVPEEKILFFLREGRLVSKNPLLVCERCGKPIFSGRYCEKCCSELTGTVEPEYKPSQKEPEFIDAKGRMHTIDRHRVRQKDD